MIRLFTTLQKKVQFIKINLMFQYPATREEIENKINSSNGSTVL